MEVALTTQRRTLLFGWAMRFGLALTLFLFPKNKNEHPNL
jgi:hypothetical protein